MWAWMCAGPDGTRTDSNASAEARRNNCYNIYAIDISISFIQLSGGGNSLETMRLYQR